jgi:subtilisin family serine protease
MSRMNADAVATVSAEWPELPASRVRLCTPSTRLADLVLLASQHHLVHFIEPVRRPSLLNKWSRGMAQSGVPFTEPLSAAGIRGEGTVIGFADTGVDTDHCFFTDPDVSVPYDRFDASHRKIVRYTSAVPASGREARMDFVEGHGTHVAGTLAGSVLAASGGGRTGSVTTGTEEFHGVAPLAKLTFTDLAASGEGIMLPASLENIFNTAASDGAGVHSNSWGIELGRYDSASQEVDATAVRHPNLLVLFAAGNSADAACVNTRADDERCDRFTVMSPSTAKNSLSVGASMAVMASWVKAGHGNHLLRLTDPQQAHSAASWVQTGMRAYRAEFGTEADYDDLPLKLSDPPGEGCVAPAVGALTGYVWLVHRGTCTFGVKALYAAAAGARGIIIINNIPGDPIIMGNDKLHPTVVNISAYMISRDDGNLLEALVQLRMTTGQTTLVKMHADPTPDAHKDPENLSSFSSHGPTLDFRYKPDIVGVGEFVHSAYSDASLSSFNCNLWASMGTSMATPLIAGNAALVQEYFRRGFYPSGRENAQAGLVLRSDALKAVLVHAAVPLHGLFDRNSQGDWRRLGLVPSFEQGHGTVRLNASLPILPPDVSISSAIQPELFVRQNHSAHTGTKDVFCLRFAPSPAHTAFRAVLAWIDPPGSPSGKYQLVNDLDLRVELPNGQQYFGNSHRAGGDAATAADRLNNLERVYVPNAPRWAIPCRGSRRECGQWHTGVRSCGERTRRRRRRVSRLV